MKFNSIKFKAVAILVPLVIIPMLLVGVAGTLFYRDVIRQNIWDDNLAQTKALTAYEDSYLNYSSLYLKSLASRPLVISDLESNNSAVLSLTAQFASESTDFNSTLVTDRRGTVKSSFPNQWMVGSNLIAEPYVGRAVGGSDYIGGAILNETGVPVIYLSVPVMDQNDTVLGAIVGEIDSFTITNNLLKTLVKNGQYVYMVNNTGHIIAHSNQSYVKSRANFSAVPMVQEAIKGNSGVMEYYNPVEGDTRLGAYAAVPGTGWGIVVAVPDYVAYRPLYDSTYLFAAIVTALMLITGVIAFLLGNYLVGPIAGISTATKQMTNGGDYNRYLPLSRNDEIGELARSFDSMARRIAADKDRITEEKNRAELYIDVMGHDINNLNQSAMANLELIKDDPNLTEDEKKSIQDALTAVRGSAGIIDNVRKIQRINDEKIDIVPEDLNSLIEACIRDAPRPPGKKVTINYAPRPGLMVRGNPLLKEAFCNIIGNSIKYSGNEVTIDIAIDRVSRAARPFYDVTIADNGYGIPDDVKPKLFQRFQRGTMKAHGKGLGLYIVRSLVEKLGGSVRVEDRVPGDYRKGAKLIISLPAYEEGGDGR